MSRNVPELNPERYGLPLSGEKYNVGGLLHVGNAAAVNEVPIEDILKTLNDTYCGKIAYEFRHIPNISERRWFSHMIESYEKNSIDDTTRTRYLHLLSKSEVFDQFMGKRFTQVKRYGLEGAESMLVALDALFRTSNRAGVIDVVLGMPHRGRLNLLTGMLNFSPAALFHKIRGENEFEDFYRVSGDVLSHLAQSVDLDYGNSRPLHISLLHNPSHLEAINPVAMGKARAKQMDLYASNAEGSHCMLGDRVMCVQLHGDAAFVGQGVVMESLGLSNLPHFTSGGSVHIVVNNQIGYTTPALNARSSIYASDVGKMISAPVIHVNGDHPEEVAHAAIIAFEYRNKFRKDVILDIVTYRRWGHNELDEPAFTQPIMYNIIRNRKSVPELYQDAVGASVAEVTSIRDGYFADLDKHLESSKTYKPSAQYLEGKWSKIKHPEFYVSRIDTGVDVETLKKVGIASVTVDSAFAAHPRLLKHHLQSRATKVQSGSKIDWATAEALAMGSLMLEGHDVRISGQDVGRGTFSQRHAMLVDQNDERIAIPLNNMDSKQGYLEVANSSLSEFAVMGFEFGMSWETPNNLNIWEAQFGDFFNGAQVIVDTFLCSSEQKWLRQSGLVLLLPHGYDGAGPEHSSCRVERFLQSSDDPINSTSPYNCNWHVVNPTTPAQYFHVLRRQLKRSYRKPLIVVAPKTLLKLNTCISDMAHMAPSTSFEPVLIDSEIKDREAVKRLVFVSGKLYYDLVKEKASRKLDSIAFVRLEELSPFPRDGVANAISMYPGVQEFVWCQEEPQNMGAFSFVQPRIHHVLPEGATLRFVGRNPSAAPATGIGKVYRNEQKNVIEECFRD